MAQVVEILAFVAMGGVVITLVMGLGAMYSGGPKNKSNLFMRWRVGLQFLAIALLALVAFVIEK